MNNVSQVLRTLFLLLLAASAPVAWAQSAALNQAIYLYKGADRAQRLVEKARQEGVVVVYTSLATTESTPLAKAFEKKYGGDAVSVAAALADRPSRDVLQVHVQDIEKTLIDLALGHSS